MSATDASFERLQGALRSLWEAHASPDIGLEASNDILLLRASSDVAAFAILDEHPDRGFSDAYGTFKRLYRENSSAWDTRTLSFVVCRSSDDEEDDRFYAGLETDPLFCRKYIIRAKNTVDAQREELLRLPFLPLPTGGGVGLQRPQPAQDLLQSAGLSAALARNLIEPGRRSPDGITIDLLRDAPSISAILPREAPAGMALSSPRASSRLTALTVEAFRAYRDARTFDLDASVIVLYGPNGLGKTSFFDALDYACTGRIGRLCRTRRNPTDFSRIATHLDKAPGSGSVTVTLKSSPTGTPWKLQRSTGNWSTAWIDGEEADRKTVLNRLTHATWLDTTPRQQTIDSLFRATHLFGQDDQELLSSFRKGSVIPEEFVSEMLSLQDYSEGVSKLEAVQSQLSRRRNEVEETLRDLNQQRATLSESLAQQAVETGGMPAPIEATLTALRQDADWTIVGLQPLPDTLAVSAYREWLDVAASETEATGTRLSALRAVLAALPAYERSVREHREAQDALNGYEKALSVVDEDERTLAADVRRHEDELHVVTGRRNDLRAKLATLTQTASALARRAQLRQQVNGLSGERDRQIVALRELEQRLAATEAAISTETAKASGFERSAFLEDARFRRLQELVEGLSQFDADLAFEASVLMRRKDADESLQHATETRDAAARHAQTARVEREGREDDYQRAVSARATVDRLLAELHSHVDGDTCPLCGTAFESAEALRAAIHQERHAGASPTSVLLVYPQLRSDERLAQDRLRVASRELDECQRALDELIRVQTATADRLSQFRSRLAEFVDVDARDGKWATVLGARQQDLSDSLDASRRAAEEARRLLDEVAATRSSLSAQRDAVHSRVSEVERTVRDLQDQTATIDGRISQALPPHADAGAELDRLTAALTQDLTDAEAALLGVEERVKQKRDAAAGLADQKRMLLARRSASAATLTTARAAMAAVEEQMRAHSVPGSPDNVGLERLARATEERLVRISALVARVRSLMSALSAREERTRSEQVRVEMERLDVRLGEEREQLGRVDSAARLCRDVDAMLKRERQGSIERHIAAYGPMITMIQQRLRSVYGFGEVQLEASGGEAKVHVEWRNRSIHVPPTDFFSDSQKQILMLSIFLAGGLRQNWSGFAPVLLDDPITHFDDLNAYAFVELIRGIIATSPSEWQFIVSTCEQRLFDLMHRKFSRLQSGARFYEFVGMTSSGPIVERR